MKWLPYPMLRIAAFFSGGILLSIYFPDFLSIKNTAWIIGFFTMLFLAIKLYFKESRFTFYSGFLGLLIIFLLGYVQLKLSTDSRKENHLSKIEGSIKVYEAIVKSVPDEKTNSWKVEIEIIKISLDDSISHWVNATGNLLLYVSKKGVREINWRYGDKILVRGSPQELNPPGNPGEFDFKRFLSFKNTWHQHFVKAADVQFVSATTYRGFIYYSHRARAWSIQKLNRFVRGNDEQAIARALVLGVTDGIDNDLQNAYAASGAMHVLAVSGMHVGIIYVIILFLFKPLDKYRFSKWFVAVFSLLLLWSFSFITGNSPSVLRAVTMFSFVALARPLGWKTNIYNTLAASAFVLLIYNPYLIMSVGFQLSYLAVLGIVYLQRPLYRLWEIENVVGDWIWKITCVSIAAQVATFALGLLYFHQFPSYFLISNLFVIPLSTLVLVIGIFLLAINFFAPIASLTGMILELLIKALNWIVFTTEDLPLSLINNIHITTLQCWLLIGIIIFLILLFEFRSTKWLYASFVFTIVFVVLQWLHFDAHVNQKQLIVYSINRHSAIEFIDNGRSYFVCDSILQNDTEKIRFHILPNRISHGVAQITSNIPFKMESNKIELFKWNNRIIARIKNKLLLPENLSCDYLIVSNNSLNKKQIAGINAKQIIFDGSNSKSVVESLIDFANRYGIATYSVLKQGAFILK